MLTQCKDQILKLLNEVQLLRDGAKFKNLDELEGYDRAINELREIMQDVEVTA